MMLAHEVYAESLVKVIESVVRAIESSESAPTYYNKRVKLINDVVRQIAYEVETTGMVDVMSSKDLFILINKYLNENKTWLRISAYLKFPEAIDKELKYHTLYHAATHGYVNAMKDDEGWIIEKNSFYMWLKSYPYGAYGGR